MNNWQAYLKRDAIGWLLEPSNPSERGRWMQKFFEFEALGKPSKWVTLHAMKMLKNLYGSVEHMELAK